ncbi:MAG: hypothetical protein AAF449_25210, partial [Myxococcota bacterium]
MNYLQKIVARNALRPKPTLLPRVRPHAEGPEPEELEGASESVRPSRIVAPQATRAQPTVESPPSAPASIAMNSVDPTVHAVPPAARTSQAEAPRHERISAAQITPHVTTPPPPVTPDEQPTEAVAPISTQQGPAGEPETRAPLEHTVRVELSPRSSEIYSNPQADGPRSKTPVASLEELLSRLSPAAQQPDAPERIRPSESPAERFDEATAPSSTVHIGRVV